MSSCLDAEANAAPHITIAAFLIRALTCTKPGLGTGIAALRPTRTHKRIGTEWRKSFLYKYVHNSCYPTAGPLRERRWLENCDPMKHLVTPPPQHRHSTCTRFCKYRFYIDRYLLNLRTSCSGTQFHDACQVEEKAYASPEAEAEKDATEKQVRHRGRVIALQRASKSAERHLGAVIRSEASLKSLARNELRFAGPSILEERSRARLLGPGEMPASSETRRAAPSFVRV